MTKAKLQIIVMIVTLAVVITGCSTPSQPGSPNVGPRPGNLAPSFTLTTIDGRTFSLADFRGKPVMLNFWASWCGPCRYEMPFIQAIFGEWTNRIVVLTINISDSQAAAKEFVTSYGYTFPVLLDSGGKTATDYQIRAIPTTFFIDTNGIIKTVKLGAFQNKAEIESLLKEL